MCSRHCPLLFLHPSQRGVSTQKFKVQNEKYSLAHGINLLNGIETSNQKNRTTNDSSRFSTTLSSATLNQPGMTCSNFHSGHPQKKLCLHRFESEVSSCRTHRTLQGGGLAVIQWYMQPLISQLIHHIEIKNNQE